MPVSTNAVVILDDKITGMTGHMSWVTGASDHGLCD
jgi:hypothetical protein